LSRNPHLHPPPAASKEIRTLKRKLLAKDNKLKDMEHEIKRLKTELEASEKATPSPEVSELALMLNDLQTKHPGNAFLFSLLEQQFKCLLCNNAKGFQWSEDIIHWTTSLTFFGRVRALEIVHGKGCQANGSFDVDPKDWCLVLPNISSIKNHVPLLSHINHSFLNSSNKFRRCFQSSSGLGALFLMKLKSELEYVTFSTLVVSLALMFLCWKRMLELSWIKISNQRTALQKKVLQVFFVSLDGTISLPLCFFPTTGSSGSSVFQKLSPLMSSFAEHGIEITWGSSDGFSGSSDFVRKMHLSFPQYAHVFDYIHILKNL
jgi:hypothetical protein